MQLLPRRTYFLGTNLAKLDSAEIEANRRGTSKDDKAAIAVAFATKLTINRGKVSDRDLQIVRDAGYSDAEVVEIVGHVAVNTLTNYINESLGTVIDFPTVNTLAA